MQFGPARVRYQLGNLLVSAGVASAVERFHRDGVSALRRFGKAESIRFRFSQTSSGRKSIANVVGMTRDA